MSKKEKEKIRYEKTSLFISLVLIIGLTFYYINSVYNPKTEYFETEVCGISMCPTLQNGDILTVTNLRNDKHSFDEVEVGDIVVIRLHLFENIIKRVNEIDGDKVYVLGDNPEHSEDSRSFGYIDASKVIGYIKGL